MTQDNLFNQLKHPNPHLRDRALWELAENYDEATIAQLIANLEEEDVVYRRASVKTLGAIGAAAVPDLVNVTLNHTNVTARASAVKAMTQVAVMYADEPFPQVGIDALQAALNDSNPVVYVAAVMTLGEIGGAAAFDILAEALKTTDNVALAVAIVNAMPAIGDERAKQVLEDCTQDESLDVYIRQIATSALSRLELVANNQPA